jgi:hypothetical protein
MLATLSKVIGVKIYASWKSDWRFEKGLFFI